MEEELLAPKKRGRPPKQKEPEVTDPGPVVLMEEPPLVIDEPGVLDEFDQIFGDELTDEARADLDAYMANRAAANAEVPSATAPVSTKPGRGKFIALDNGLYLPVRQRIVWMRGEPEQHPDWLIQTEIIRFEEGTFTGTKTIFRGTIPQDVPDVKGGWAMVQARVLCRREDGSEGPIIGEGSALERSEMFWDYLEKAETAAIGRAMAVAGYGTEAAIDLDEGEFRGQINLPDAPVRVPGVVPQNTPPPEIKIESSNQPQPLQGGRQQSATTPQLNAIRDRARDLLLSPIALQKVIRETVEKPDELPDPNFWSDDVEDGPNGANDVMGFLADLTFQECGAVVQALMEK